MKKIYFIRHAKAKKDGKTDFLRALNDRGVKNAKELSTKLKELEILPDIIFSSSAVRALSTANIIADKLSKKVLEKDELYDISTKKLLEFVRAINSEFDTVFIVGHNPAMLEISELLSDSAIGKMPTCAIFGIKFDALKFEDIKEHSGEVILYNYPVKD